MRLAQASDKKTCLGSLGVNAACSVCQHSQVALHLLSTRAGQETDDGPGPSLLVCQESFLELLHRQLVEVWMADVVSFDTTLLVPCLLERQVAADVIDEPAHPADAPAGPGPELR